MWLQSQSRSPPQSGFFHKSLQPCAGEIAERLRATAALVLPFPVLPIVGVSDFKIYSSRIQYLTHRMDKSYDVPPVDYATDLRFRRG